MQMSHYMSSHQEQFLARDGRATLLAGKWGGSICNTQPAQHPFLYDHRIFKIFNSTFHPNTPRLKRRTNPVWLTTIKSLNLSHFTLSCWLKSGCQGPLDSAGNVVINFGLQWSLQNTAKLKSSIENDLSVHSGCRKHRRPENTQCWCNFFGPLSQKSEEYPSKILIINMSPLPHNNPCLRRFPQKFSSEATAVFVLGIHGRLGLEELLDHSIVAVFGCYKQRCCTSGPGPTNPQAKTNGTKGENFQKFWAPRKSNPKLRPLQNSFDMSWGHGVFQSILLAMLAVKIAYIQL